MQLIDKLLSLIAPMQCIGCNKEGLLVCAWCKPELIDPVPQRCVGCMRQAEDARTCQKCRQTYQLPAHVWVRAVYDGPIKVLLHKLKFGRGASAAQPLADYLAEALPFLPRRTVIVPVPTAARRIRQRGYDQSTLIAKNVAQKTDTSHMALLERTSSARQVGAPRSVRKTQMASAFVVKGKKLAKNTPIVLVDDIYTTGGTLSACTVALKKAGYKNVDAAIVAQAM